MIKNFLAVGQIVGTHGVRGEMRVNPWADSPEFLKQFKTLYYDAEGKNSVGVISARPHGNIVLMKLEDIDTVEAASAMRNKRLYMRRSDARLPDGVYFIEELIGCSFAPVSLTSEIFPYRLSVSSASKTSQPISSSIK